MTVPAEQRRAIRGDAVALASAVAVYGVSFGALAVAAGLDLTQTSVLSLVMFTGASQLALVGVLADGGAAVAAVGVAWLLGARNALYAVRLSSLIGLRGRRRLVAAQLVIDETVAMAVAQPEPARARFAFFASGVAMYTFWNVSTLVGALVGSAIGDPRAFGLDVAFPAAFVALLAPLLRERAARITAALAVVLALAAVPVAPAGVPVLAAALAVLPLGLRR